MYMYMNAQHSSNAQQLSTQVVYCHASVSFLASEPSSKLYEKFVVIDVVERAYLKF